MYFADDLESCEQAAAGEIIKSRLSGGPQGCNRGTARCRRAKKGLRHESFQLILDDVQ